jgi:hypothetical protein
MTNPALRAMDALIHRQLSAAGLAEGPESAQYRYPAGSDPVPVRAYVDRSMQQMGDLATEHAPRTIVAIFKEDVPNPRIGATVTVQTDAGAEVFTLDAPDAIQDESMSRWVVSHG